MPSNPMETRAYGRELRIVQAEKGKTLTGYAAVFNARSVDLGGWTEQIQPGAFTRTLKEMPDVFALYHHDSALILGRTASGTLQMAEDETGLRFQCVLPETTTANDLAALIERGDVTGCSFGFCTRKDEWTTDPRSPLVRTLLDVDLYEITITAMPAYPQTALALRAAAFRTLPDEMRSALPCMCPCAQCGAGACNLCSAEACDFAGCTCPEKNSKSPRTKTVDGESLTADCFLIVLDPKKTDTWNLPWKFSTEEKTKSHLRDALARFDQVQDVPEDVKKEAWTKLVELCKQHGIDVSSKDGRAAREHLELRLKLAQLRAHTGR